MKSVVLILWLTLASGKEQVILTRHLDDMDKCAAEAKVLVEQHARRNERVRYLCHEVVEEVGDVDVNGNPIN